MTAALRRIFWLGAKELTTLARDPLLVLFILYALTLHVATAGNGVSLEVQNAAVAIVDEDRSPLSRSIADALQPPFFREPSAIDARDVGPTLDRGQATFVLHVPPGFERDLLDGADPALQLDVDATAVGQAFLGASYLERVVGRETARRLGPAASAPPPAEARVRVRFNPNRESTWHVGLTELFFVLTLLAMVLPAASLLREREHGTVEHLLSLPLRPLELMLAKVWAYALVVLVGSALSLALVIQGLFGTPVRGSYALLLAATVLYQLATAGLGIVLATLARTVAQVALLAVLTVTPLLFLSGVWTPLESMPAAMRAVTWLSPLRYYAELCFAVIFRDAGLDVVWPQLAVLAVMGAALLAFGALRFRTRFAAASG